MRKFDTICNKIIQEDLNQKLDTVQTALDIVGASDLASALVGPEWELVAMSSDAINSLISVFRTVSAKTNDERKKHALNAAISAVSIIPAGDIIKLLKLRKAPALAKAAIKGTRMARKAARNAKIKGRFNNDQTKQDVEDLPNVEAYKD